MNVPIIAASCDCGFLSSSGGYFSYPPFPIPEKKKESRLREWDQVSMPN